MVSRYSAKIIEDCCVLGIEPTDNMRIVYSNYKDLIRNFHPDKQKQSKFSSWKLDESERIAVFRKILSSYRNIVKFRQLEEKKKTIQKKLLIIQLKMIYFLPNTEELVTRNFLMLMILNSNWICSIMNS